MCFNFRDLKEKVNKWVKRETKISQKNIEIIILALTFLTLALVQIIVATYESTVIPIAKWIVLLNVIPFVIVILLIAMFILFFEYGTFWKLFTIFAIIAIYVSLVTNFSLLFPNFYISYQFSCDLDLNSKPILNLILNNAGKRISVNHILINVSDKRYYILTGGNVIDGNMIYTLLPNQNFKTSFLIDPPHNANNSIKITNQIDCGRFSCYTLGITPSDKECLYECNKNECILIDRKSI